jgi:hypothetical protein
MKWQSKRCEMKMWHGEIIEMASVSGVACRGVKSLANNEAWRGVYGS